MANALLQALKDANLCRWEKKIHKILHRLHFVANGEIILYKYLALRR